MDEMLASDVRLASARTTMRPLGPGDLAVMHAMWIDPGVRKYLWDDIVIDRARAAEVLAATAADFAQHRYGLWAVHDKTSGELAGFCGLRSADDGVPELLFGFLPRYWGKGLATETARAVLSYAFHTLGYAEVVAATDAPNVASARVLERIGMQFDRRGALNSLPRRSSRPNDARAEAGLDTLFYRLRRDRLDR